MFLAIVLFAASTASAQVVRPFTERASFDQQGEIIQVGNVLMTCQAGGNCAQVQAGTTTGNNARQMVYVTTNGGQNSSRADLNIPAGATVDFAGLYWGGRANPTNDNPGVLQQDRASIEFIRPGFGAQTLTGASVDTFATQGAATSRPYQAFIDVTGLVQASGSGTYVVRNAKLATGNDGLGFYGGWSLVVITSDSNQPFRSLRVFDGAAVLSAAGVSSLDLPVTGLLTPAFGPVDAEFGALVWEGDQSITGDSLAIESGAGPFVTLSDVLNPANNAFNSSITDLGVRITNKLPDYVNQLAMDIDTFDASGILGNSQTDTTLRFQTGGDTYFPNVATFSAELFVPDVETNFSKTMTDVNGGTLEPGDEIIVRLFFDNIGQDAATNLVLTDPIPANTTYVPGSLFSVQDPPGGLPPNTPLSDGVGDDTAEFDVGNNRVVFRSGTGADTTTGGTVPPGELGVRAFRVRVNPGTPPGTDIINIADFFHNSATFPARPFTGSTTDTITTGLSTPSLDLEKTIVAGSPYANVGDLIQYTLTATNNSALTISNAVISDPQAVLGACAPAQPATLAPGASITCPATYTVSQADIDNGSFTNTARVDGTAPGPVAVQDTDSATAAGPAANPALTLVKTGTLNDGGDGVADAGDTISYSFTVTNTGNVTLTNVTVSDPQVTVVGGPIASLAPGASDSVTFTASYVLTQADINAGTFTNTATANSAQGASDTDSDTQNLGAAPTLSLLKSILSGDPFDTVGDVIGYQFLVTNTGNVSLSGPVVVNDDLTADESCPAVSTVGNGDGLLDPGESIICTASYTVTQADIDAGSVSNTASASADGTTSNDSSAVASAGQLPALDTVKSLDSNADGDGSGDVSLGDVLTYTVTVTNTGNQTLTNVTVTDTLITPSSTSCASVAPGATCVLTGTYTVTQPDVDAGSITNTGTGDSDQTPPNDDSLVTPIAQDAGLDTAKALTGNADGDGSGDVTLGDVLSYTVTVTNTGNQTLTNVTVTDTLITPSSTSCASVAPGGTCVLTGTYTVTQADVDAGSITNTGTGDSDETPPDDDTLITPLAQLPALNTVKALTNNADSDGSGDITLGDVLTYTVTVTNTGNQTLTNVTVTDTLITPSSTSCASVAPGATCVLTGTYTVIQTDVDTGSITNTGTGDSDQTPPDDDTLVTPTGQNPGLSTTKALTSNADGDGSGDVTLGDVLTYTVTVTNTGNQTLTNVTVTDTLITPSSISCASLAPGGTCVLTGTYLVTQADVDAGSITNTGTGDSDQTPPDDDTLITPAAQRPALSTSKALTGNADGDGSGDISLGDVLTYTVTATNTGNQTLTNVTVTDTLIAPSSISCASVAPGGTCVLTGTYTVIQADVDSGSITNTGTGNSDQTPPDDDTLITPVAQLPALNTDKELTSNADGDGSGDVTLGDVLTYTVTVTNTGSQTLTNVTVTDTLITPSSTSCASLAPSGTCVLTGTYTVTQADVDAGSITNTGTGDSDQTPPNDDTVVTPVAQVGAIELVKTIDSGNPFDSVGDVIVYTLTATNTGNVTLSNVTITDAAATIGVCPPTTLAPGDSFSCSALYSITQADLDAGSFVNTATADGLDPNGSPVTDSDSATANANVSGALDVVKVIDAGDPYASVGDALSYTITATNTGNVTLTGVSISDPQATVGACTPAQPVTLAPGASISCPASYSVLQTDLDAGSFTNTATGAGQDPDGNPVSGTDQATATATQTGTIDLVKTIDGGDPYANVGDVIDYTLTATNTGNVTLDNAVISDPGATIGSCTPAQPAALAPGATLVCDATYTVTQADLDAGDFTNTATVSAQDPGANPVSDTDSATANATRSPALDLSKVIDSGDPYANVGDGILYTITATNSGNVTLDNVLISDPNAVIGSCNPAQPTTLAPGETLVCGASHTVTQADIDTGSFVNIATVNAEDPGGNPLSASDTATANAVQTLALSLVKAASLNDDNGNGFADAGEVIDYTMTSVNTGNVTLADVEITDPLIGALSCTPLQPTTLTPGDTLVCTGSYTVTAADVAAGGFVNNTATVTAPDPFDPINNPPVENTSSTSTPVVPVPVLTLVKIAVLDDTNGNGFADIGETIDYTLTATNDGNIALSDVEIVDPLIGALSCTPAQPAALAPTEQLVCTGSYTVSQSDLDNGPDIVNVATVAAPDPVDPINNPPVGDSDTETVPTEFDPLIELTKTVVSGNPYANVGDLILYNLTATNVGNVTLDNVTITDPVATVGPCPATTLAPGDSLSCTATYTVTQADIDAGSFTNTADADGEDPNGDPVNDEDSAVASATQAPALATVKALIGNADGDASGTVSLGDVLTYTVTVTNTGNQTLTNVVVTDTRISPSSTTCAALAPGAACVLTGTYTVTQADVDAGQIDNTGTGDSDQTPPSIDTVSTPVPQNPALVLAKNGTLNDGGDGIANAGDTISYVFTVTNTGNVTLTNITLTDPLVAVIGGPIASLAPGASDSSTFTASYTLTQADIDAGTFTNTATADSDEGASDDDDDTQALASSPLIALAKVVDSGSPYSNVGDVIGYTLTATNTGNTTLSNVAITDPQATVGACTPAQPATLPPGASIACPATYTVTQADLDTGSFSNTATASGQDPSATPVSDDDTAVAIATQTPSLNLTKLIDAGDPYAVVGDVIDYTITATNDGNVTLTDVSISDPQATIGACTPAQPASLAPGATLSCAATYTVTQADIDSGSFTNTATGTGLDPIGDPVADSDQATATATQNGRIELVKTIDSGSPYSAAGDVIDYTLTATNTGNLTLDNVSISDPQAAIGACTPAQPASLAPGATLVCDASYTVTQADVDGGSFVNTATVTGEDPGNNPVSDSDSATATATRTPALDLVKSASLNDANGNGFADAGESIDYTLTTTNTGNVTLAGVTTVDPLLGALSCTPAQPATLAPAAQLVCTGSYTVTAADVTAGGTVTNTATSSAPDPIDPVNNPPLEDTDSTSTPVVPVPVLTLVKIAVLDDTNGNGFADIGETIDYTLTAINDGNIALSDVEIVDPLIGALSCTPAQPAALAPTEQLVCTGSYTVSQSDLDNGPDIVNVATVAAPDPVDPINNPPVGDSDTETVPTEFDPLIELTKTVVSGNPYANVGDLIVYNLTATNVGNVTLDNVTITDPVATVGPCPATTLAPGDSLSCTATYTVTQADIDAGSFTNTADADGEDPNGDPVNDEDSAVATAVQTPALALDKVLSGNADEDASGNVTLGDTLTYGLVATNTGNVTLTSVTIVDSLIGGLSCAPAQPAALAPGDTLSCSGTYVVQQADVDAGSIVNTGTADSDQTGPVQDVETVAVVGPEVVATKTSNPASGSEVVAGQTITYTLSVTVADAPLTAPLVLSDTLGAGLSFGAVTVPGGFTANTAGNPLSFTLPSGTPAGAYSVSYTATVDPDAAGNVGNSVLPTGGGDPDPECPSCTTSHPLADPVVVATKASNPASGTEVTAGQTITYTLTATVSDAALTSPLVLSDTLGAGLSFGAVTVPGAFTASTAGNPLTFTLPSGTVPGSYSVEYTAIVDQDATGNVGNSVVPTGGGDPDPECPSCTTSHPLADPVIVATKASNPASGTELTAGQTITYTLTATVSDAALTADLVLTDTLGAGLSFGAVTVPGAFTANTAGNPLTFTLPSGTVPGSYSVEYTATVDQDATGNVGNNVVPTGGGDPDPECPSCTTSHPLADPVIVVDKAAAPVNGTEVFAGQAITYTLTATVSDAALTADLVLTDTLGAGLTFGAVTVPGAFTANTAGNPLTFTLPSGTVPGSYSVEYTATVDQDATGNVGNNVVPTGGGDPDPECPSCTTSHPVGVLALDLVKSASLNDSNGNGLADVGEVIDYTLTATNNSTVALPGTTISDPMIPALSCTPPQPATLNPTDQLVCTGSYTVQQSDIDAGTDIINTATTQAPDPVTPGNPDLTDTDTANVGICDATTGDITGRVWEDLNRDNVIDPGEPFHTSFLTLGTVGGDPLDRLVTTADPVTGVYDFTGIPEGTYELRILEAYLANNFNLYVIQPSLRIVTVTRCGTVVEDFNVAPPLLGVIGDFVWFDFNENQVVDEFRDADGNGVLTQNPLGTPFSATDFEWVDLNQDGEPNDGEFRRCGAADVEVQLFDSTGNVVGSRFTNLRGEYFFLDLPLDETYTAVVDETNPANFVAVQQFVTDGNCIVLPPRGSQAPPRAPAAPRGGPVAGCGATTPLTLTSNPLTAAVPVDDDLDFGLVCGVPGSIDLVKVLTSNADEDGSGTVTFGDTLTYTITATNIGSVALSNVVVSDSLIAPSSVTCPLVGQGETCVLTGTYVVTQPDVDAGSILNTATAGSDQTPPVQTQLTVPVIGPEVSVVKSADPASGTIVDPGDTLTYTLTVDVTDAPLSQPLVLTDTLGAGLSFGAVTVPGAFTANTAGNPLTFTLPSGTVPGSYSVEYTATVDIDASGAIGNNVVPTGGGDPDPECPICTTSHTVRTIALAKNVIGLNATGPNTWRVEYEIVVDNPGTTAVDYTLTDTLGFTTTGLQVGATGFVSTTGGTLNPALAGGTFTPAVGAPLQVSDFDVTIAAGTTHRYSLVIPFGVVAGQLQDNTCTGAPGDGLYNLAELAGPIPLSADACASIDEGGDVAIQLVKTVELGVDFDGNNYGDVGDVLFYEFTITNTGSQPLTEVQLIDLLVDDLQCLPRASDGEPIDVLPYDAIRYDGFERGGLGTLNPAATVSCSATHELTAQDVARRRVENTATALGTGPNGEVVSSVSTAVYTAFQ